MCLNGCLFTSSWATALQEAINAWNATPCDFSYSIVWGDLSVAEGNGENEVWWSDTTTHPAYCSYWYYESTCEIIEADVVFNLEFDFTTSSSKVDLTPYGGSSRPFRTTAVHELGHAQGLGHTADTYSSMGQSWNACSYNVIASS